MTTAQDGGKFASLTHRPPLLTGNASGTHSANGRMKISKDTSWDRASDLLTCSTAPYPLCYRSPPNIKLLRLFFFVLFNIKE